MPIMRFPGTVPRPAETIVKQIDLISAALCVSEYRVLLRYSSPSLSFASGSLRILPVIQGLSSPLAIFSSSISKSKVRYLSLLNRYSCASVFRLGHNRKKGM